MEFILAGGNLEININTDKLQTDNYYEEKIKGYDRIAKKINWGINWIAELIGEGFFLVNFFRVKLNWAKGFAQVVGKTNFWVCL